MDEKIRSIYKILTELEKAMELKEPADGAISCEALGISETLKYNLIRMLAEEGLITGVGIDTTTYGDAVITKIRYHDRYLYLTHKGLEYLHENSLMKKVRAEELSYNHEEIERELGYKIKTERVVCEPIKLSELRELLEAGWVIIDTKPTSEKHVKILTLIDSHVAEE